jgi:transcriptional regulator with XRE-family HTH domain
MAELGDVVAANVRAERARLRITQDDLGQRLGWSRGRVGHLETGRRDVRATDLPALCRALGCDLGVLMRGADERDIRALGWRQP